MIDIGRERLLTLQQAAKLIPGRPGKSIHFSSIYRWAGTGISGVVLETVQVGGKKMTSVEALQRFIEASTAATPCPAGDRQGRPEPLLRSRRKGTDDRVTQALIKAGIISPEG